MNTGSIVSFILSGIFLISGFFKMYFYEAGETNAYVGGDAYNFIINANFATGYFTLAIFCAVVGLIFIVNSHLSDLVQAMQNPKGDIDNIETVKKEFMP